MKSPNASEDIDISVHWDATIFEWLLNYIEQNEKETQKNENIIFYDVVIKDGENYKIATTVKRKRPVFEIGTAISILISSDYL